MLDRPDHTDTLHLTFCMKIIAKFTGFFVGLTTDRIKGKTYQTWTIVRNFDI